MADQIDLTSMVQQSLNDIGAQGAAGMDVKKAGTAAQRTLTDATTAEATAQFMSGQVQAESQKRAEAIQLESAQRQQAIATHVVDIVNASRDAIDKGRQMVSATGSKTIDLIQQAKDLEDSQPNPLLHPIGFVANRWKAARTRDAIQEQVKVAQMAGAQVNQVVQTTSAQIGEIAQAGNLEDAAATRLAIAQRLQGFAPKITELGADAQAAGTIARGASGIFSTAYQTALWAQGEADRKLRGQQLRLSVDELNKQKAADDLAIDFYLKQHGIAKNPQTAAAAQRQVETWRQADPQLLATMSMAGSLSLYANDGPTALTHVLNSGVLTVAQAQKLGVAIGNPSLAGVGNAVSAAKINEYKTQFDRGAYEQWLVANNKTDNINNKLMFDKEDSTAAKQLRQKQAQEAAKADIGSMPLTEYAYAQGGKVAIPTGGLNLAKIGVPEAAAHYGFAPNTPEAKLLTDPNFKILVSAQAAHGGAANATVFQIPTIYEAARKAKVADPAAFTARLLADEAVAAMRTPGTELRALNDMGLDLTAPATINVNGTQVPIGDPTVLRSMMVELAAQRDKKGPLEAIGDWASRLIHGDTSKADLTGTNSVLAPPQGATKQQLKAHNELSATVDAVRKRTQGPGGVGMMADNTLVKAPVAAVKAVGEAVSRVTNTPVNVMEPSR